MSFVDDFLQNKSDEKSTHDGVQFSLIRDIDELAPKFLTTRTVFWGLYFFSLIINLVVGFAHNFRASYDLLAADEAEYVQLANALLDGSLMVSARRTLGFPVILAAIFSISKNIVFLQCVIAAIYAFSAPMLFMAVRRLTGALVAAAIAGVALALWPASIFQGVSVLSESAALPMFLGVLAWLPAGSRLSGKVMTNARAAIISGLMLGVLTHVRPMYLLFLPILLMIIVIEERHIFLAAKRFSLIMVAYLVIILPWSVYVSTTFHRPILLSSNGGETLAGGLSPVLLEPRDDYVTATGRSTWVGAGKWISIQDNGYLTKQELALPYEAQDKLMRDRALAWIFSNPKQAIYIELCKLGYIWGVYPITKMHPVEIIAGNIPIVVLLVFSIVSLLARPVLALALARFWTQVLFVSAVGLISWGSWRFRQPADAALLAVATLSALSIGHVRQLVRRALLALR